MQKSENVQTFQKVRMVLQQEMNEKKSSRQEDLKNVNKMSLRKQKRDGICSIY